MAELLTSMLSGLSSVSLQKPVQTANATQPSSPWLAGHWPSTPSTFETTSSSQASPLKHVFSDRPLLADPTVPAEHEASPTSEEDDTTTTLHTASWSAIWVTPTSHDTTTSPTVPVITSTTWVDVTTFLPPDSTPTSSSIFTPAAPAATATSTAAASCPVYQTVPVGSAGAIASVVSAGVVVLSLLLFGVFFGL